MSTKKPNKAQLGLMTTILEGYTDDAPYTFMAEKRTAKLVEIGMVEVNVTLTDEDGNPATRLTDEGMSYFTNDESSGEPVAQSEGTDAEPEEQGEPESADNVGTDEHIATPGEMSLNTSGIEIDDGIPVPTVRRGSNGSRYPFDALAVGQSFHVPVSESKPNPAKSLASTVSAATKRSEGAKKFIVRAVDQSDPKGPGARVFRVEV